MFQSGIQTIWIVVLHHQWSDNLYKTMKYFNSLQPLATIMLLTEEKLEMVFSSQSENILCLVHI